MNLPELSQNRGDRGYTDGQEEVLSDRKTADKEAKRWCEQIELRGSTWESVATYSQYLTKTKTVSSNRDGEVRHRGKHACVCSRA